MTFLAAIVADDTETTGASTGYTHEERMRALDMLMVVEGDQIVEVPYEGYDDDDDCCPEHEDE
jgi:hypothetical protein